VRRASAEDDSDLLWALRGGGGNYGVVTTLGYQLHPVGPVLAGGLTYPWPRAAEALEVYARFAADAPDELSSGTSLALDAGQPVLNIALCYCGPTSEGHQALEPLRKLGGHSGDSVTTMSYLDWQSAPDPSFPTGRLHFWKAGWLRELTTEAIETMLDATPGIPSRFSGIGTQRMSGASARVATEATAFAHRRPQWDFLILSQWDDPAQSQRNIEWTRTVHERMRPYLDDAAYINNLGTEGDHRVRAAYGKNYARLAELKRRYDPTNLFRHNQNILPA
jgi:FAD/FMN-containing dehydrogenase